MSDDVQSVGCGGLGRSCGDPVDVLEPWAGRSGGLEYLAETLSSCIAEASAHGMRETAELIAIARLDLMARIHEISDQELTALARFLGRRPVSRRAARARPTRRFAGRRRVWRRR